ncbi:MAG TPA: zf-HC2 domain-containing protein [Terriglobia bacterium]|nr:zf-HC2 domain-containing protein [Terriglobia bacterium]
MTCPTEYTCAVFVDGELPDIEARAVRLHLEECEQCRRLVADLRAENLVLVQCLQDVDLEESVRFPGFAEARQPVSIFRFAAGVMGTAVAFRLSTSILFGLKLPSGLGWLDPRDWARDPAWLFNAAAYVARDAGNLVNAVTQGIVALSVGAALWFGASRLLSRRAAVSSVLAMLFVLGLGSSESYALDVRKGEIPAGVTIDDSVVAHPDETSQNIDIAGDITGDLLAVGNRVTISGNVGGNVIALAGRVEVLGNIGGSLLGVAQTVIVSGHVGRNAIGAGSNVTFGKTADIGSNAMALAAEAAVEGKTQRDLIFLGGTLDMRGNVLRNLVFRGGNAWLAATTHIGGDLKGTIKEKEDLHIASGAAIDGRQAIELAPSTPEENQYLTASFYVWQIVWTLAAFIAGLLLFRIFPSLAPTGATGKDWLISGGVGFATLVSVPLAAILVGITVIGLPLALVAMALWFAGLYFSRIVVSEFVGRSLMKRSGALPLIVGVVVVAVAMNLPWIGGLISFLVRLLGLGAMALTIYRSFRLSPPRIAATSEPGEVMGVS